MAKFRINENGDLVVVLTPKEQARAKAARMGVVVSPTPSAPAERKYKTKAEIKAGLGFPCTATPPCSRRDLRTEANAAVHATTQAELATLGHAADRQPLPKA